MFAYCANSPVSHQDSSGHAVETVLDLISLGASIAEVASNPADIWAWAGLSGDLVDVLLPFFGGAGEAIRIAKVASEVADAADDLYDTSKIAKATANSVRSNAVKKAWKNEVEKVLSTGKGSRDWTLDQIDELLSTGKVKGYDGHHMKSVKAYPELAGDPNNIQFLTRKEHLLAHGGNWRNTTHGRYVK